MARHDSHLGRTPDKVCEVDRVVKFTFQAVKLQHMFSRLQLEENNYTDDVWRCG